MRSRYTNFLQVVVLLTGIIYVAIGVVFYISPFAFSWIFSIDINRDWLREITRDTFISLLYYLSRGFSALLFSVGVSMILPLFEPLRYRGLIYFTGVVFPVMSSFVLLMNGISHDELVITLMGLLFAVILILTVIALFITKNDAKAGKE
jgi:hypothetical protein